MLFIKKRRIISCLAIIIACVLSFSNVANAKSLDYEEYSQISGISTEDLEKISEIYGEEFLENTMLEYNSNNFSPYSLEDPNLPEERIPIGEYWAAIGFGEKGQIWITKDGNFGPVNHGHAGMLYAYSAYYISLIEHGGDDYSGKNQYGEMMPKGYSGITEWDNFNGLNSEDPPWSKCHTLRTYNVATPTSTAEGLPYDLGTMISAADYASMNLLGKPYNALANKEYYDSVNCATLVYRAYKNANVLGGTSISLDNPNSPTVIPKDLVEDSRLVLAFSSQWGGNPHEWN